MMAWWWLALNLAFSSDAVAPTDVSFEGNVALTPEQIEAVLLDLRRARGLIPDDCAGGWVFGIADTGPDARARLTWRPSVLNRRLTLRISDHKPGRFVAWRFEGPQGFDLVWKLSEINGGTELSMRTNLNPPGWPFKRLYEKDIQPAWLTCYETMVRTLGPPVVSDGDAP